MTVGEWILQAVLVVGLLVVLPAAIKLERALTAFRRDRTSLEQSARQLSDAIKEAELAIARLRDVSRGAGQRIGQQVERVDAATRDLDMKSSDLQLLLDRAETMAHRLERSVLRKPGENGGNGRHVAEAWNAVDASHPTPWSAPQVPLAHADAPVRRPPAPDTLSVPPPLARTPELRVDVGGNNSEFTRLVAEQTVLDAIRRGEVKP
jgi:hypothetical protein